MYSTLCSYLSLQYVNLGSYNEYIYVIMLYAYMLSCSVHLCYHALYICAIMLSPSVLSSSLHLCYHAVHLCAIMLYSSVLSRSLHLCSHALYICAIKRSTSVLSSSLHLCYDALQVSEHLRRFANVYFIAIYRFNCTGKPSVLEPQSHCILEAKTVFINVLIFFFQSTSGETRKCVETTLKNIWKHWGHVRNVLKSIKKIYHTIRRTISCSTMLLINHTPIWIEGSSICFCFLFLW